MCIDLDNQMRGKLIALLKDQLSKVLTKIDESSEGDHHEVDYDEDNY
jgi:hypothetical protein